MHTTKNKLWWDKNLAEEERKAYNLTITYSNVLSVPPSIVIMALKETHNFP